MKADEILYICRLILFLFLFFPLLCSSQTQQQMDSLAGNLQALAKKAPPENIYLQTSKGIYESGEDLWFKASVLDAQSFVPAGLSQTLYLQLREESTKKPVWQEKYAIQNGFAAGQVYLPDNLAEGIYLLEGFTAHSFYTSSGLFSAVRKIRVVKNYKSIIDAATEAVVTKKNKAAIQFQVFPEGGKLIHNIPAKLAFKAVDANGEPVTVAGTLFQEGQALQHFKSSHAGMGSLTFTPAAGKNYHIRLSEPAIDSVFALPTIQAQGISLRLVSRDSSHLVFSVKQMGGAPSKIYLRGQLRGKTACMASGLLHKELTIKLPLNEFPQQGIAEFTLFNEQMLPVAERVVYVHPEKKLFIKAELSKQPLELRKKGILKIKVTDEKNQPVSTHLGVSIFDKLYETPNDPKNILTHYYLASQLKGRIYDPAYYFDEKQPGREKALDLLLLTQGWRNYVWSEESLARDNFYNSPILSDNLAGEIRFTKKLKSAPTTGIQFLKVYSPDEKGNTKNSAMIQTDETGKFIIGASELKAGQGSYVYVKPLSSADFGPQIRLDTPFSTINKGLLAKERSYPVADTRVKPAIATLKSYETRPMAGKLSEVVVMGKGTKVFRDKYLGKLDSINKADLNTDFVCTGREKALNCFLHNKDRSNKPIEGKRYAVHLDHDLKILDPNNPTPTNWYATRALIYYNSTLKFTEEELLKRNNLTKVKGYYTQKEFYQPDYDKEPNVSGLPDVRNTLLWAPDITTDNNGEATLRFFSSDINTGFIGKIEGVSNDGILGLGTFEFSVHKREITSKPE